MSLNRYTPENAELVVSYWYREAGIKRPQLMPDALSNLISEFSQFDDFEFRIMGDGLNDLLSLSDNNKTIDCIDQSGITALFGPHFEADSLWLKRCQYSVTMHFVKGNIGIGFVPIDWDNWDKKVHQSTQKNYTKQSDTAYEPPSLKSNTSFEEWKAQYRSENKDKIPAKYHRILSIDEISSMCGVDKSTVGKGFFCLYRNGFYVNTFTGANKHFQNSYKDGDRMRITIDFRDELVIVQNVDQNELVFRFDLSHFRVGFKMVFTFSSKGTIKVLDQTWNVQ